MAAGKINNWVGVRQAGPYGALQPGLQYRFSIRALVGMGGASARGISGTVTVLA